MKRLLHVFIFLCALSTIAQPGKEAWHWQFGNDCSIDFSSGTPVSGMSSSNTIEGCASLSDANTGQLLLYTNGVYVENGSNTTMYNGVGLWGNNSATQSALIVPKPGSNSLFYVITTDQSGYSSNKGVNYSLVDITYGGGQGKVILKNQPLLPPPSTEKLTAVKHCNGKDYWIITHPYSSNAFYVYSVTSAGVNATPVISYVGSPIKDTLWTYPWDAGYLKASPNGKKLALAESNTENFAEIYDFDNSTGVVSNSLKLNFYADSTSVVHANNVAYGITFSPDNLKLYVATDSANVYQFDLSTNNASAIVASQTLIGTVFVHATNYKGQLAAMQMAPDGKIYIARVGIDTLAVINNPNNLGTSCNFQAQGFLLNLPSHCQFGLPNFIDANYAGIHLDIPDVKQCSNFPSDTLNAGTGFASYQWSTGATTNSIVINSPGTYWVTVTNDQGCSVTDTAHAYLINTIKKDTVACDSCIIDATENIVLNYNWFDGDTNSIKNFTSTGTYWIDISYAGGCTVKDTYNIVVHSSANMHNFVMPNIVTPNGDHINDEIDFSKYQFSALNIEIFDRWGLKIFESSDPNCVWKPGSNMVDGTYFTNIQYRIDCGQNSSAKTIKEFITLVR